MRTTNPAHEDHSQWFTQSIPTLKKWAKDYLTCLQQELIIYCTEVS
jgi:hypothetical protein